MPLIEEPLDLDSVEAWMDEHEVEGVDRPWRIMHSEIMILINEIRRLERALNHADQTIAELKFGPQKPDEPQF